MLLPPFLPPLEDDAAYDDHNNVKDIERDKANGIVDGHVVGPQQREGPEHGKDVEYDVSEEWPLGQGERLGDGDRTHYHCRDKYARSYGKRRREK